MSGLISNVTITGNAGDIFISEYCTCIESLNLRFRKITASDAVPLLDLFNETVNYQAYGKTAPRTLDDISKIMDRDIVRSFYTGYVIESIATGEILGRGAIGAGYSPRDDLDVLEAYVAASVDEEDGEGPSELQIGDLLSLEPTKLLPTGLSREILYKEMILTLILATKTFSEFGERLNGQIVNRLTISLIDPLISDLTGVALDDLVMRKKIIDSIFGEPLGVLLPKSIDPRNFSEHPRLVYGCDINALESLLSKHNYA